jgi:hypothetical protein
MPANLPHASADEGGVIFNTIARDEQRRLRPQQAHDIEHASEY